MSYAFLYGIFFFFLQILIFKMLQTSYQEGNASERHSWILPQSKHLIIERNSGALKAAILINQKGQTPINHPEFQDLVK